MTSAAARADAGNGCELGSPFLFTPGGTRLIQVQPTLRCNLRCLHCYSESAPGRAGSLSGGSLTGFLREAGQLGYRYVGVSGGEPLLWPDLEPFLEGALDAGFSTSIITNGTLMTARRAARLRSLAGLVAVSVDGPPKDHEAIRGPAAFGQMRRGLTALRDEGVAFALVFTLTKYNADRLGWLYEFADQVGALGVEVHPLAGAGAARDNLPHDIPDTTEFRVAAWFLALLHYHRGPGGPAVTLDVMRRERVEQSGWPMIHAGPGGPDAAPFADLVPSLVVEPDGCVVPFIYGFPRRWAVGFFERQSLAGAIDAWRSRCAAPVAGLVRATLTRLAAVEADYVDFFAEVLATATCADPCEIPESTVAPS